MTDRTENARLALLLAALALVAVGAAGSAVAPDLGIDRPNVVEPPAANGSDEGGNATGDVGAASDRERIGTDRGGETYHDRERAAWDVPPPSLRAPVGASA